MTKGLKNVVWITLEHGLLDAYHGQEKNLKSFFLITLGHVCKITLSEAMRRRDGTNQEAFRDTTLLYTKTEKKS